jgi:hypothetical protein
MLESTEAVRMGGGARIATGVLVRIAACYDIESRVCALMIQHILGFPAFGCARCWCCGCGG